MPVKTPRPGDLEPIETASRDELVSLQIARLRQSLRNAYDNVAHYRRAFDAAGVHPRDVGSLADLARFPFTTKKDLRDNYPFAMFSVPREKVVRIHASSGEVIAVRFMRVFASSRTARYFPSRSSSPGSNETPSSRAASRNCSVGASGATSGAKNSRGAPGAAPV